MGLYVGCNLNKTRFSGLWENFHASFGPCLTEHPTHCNSWLFPFWLHPTQKPQSSKEWENMKTFLIPLFQYFK